MNPYENLQPANNVGNAFMQSFQQGQANRRESETQNALTQYALDPNNPEAMQGLAKYNPQMAIGLQERKRQEAMRGLESHRENIIAGAKIFRQIGVKDQASYDMARQMAQQVGIDLSEVPPQYDPQYVDGVVKIADALAPEKQQGTAMQQNYEFLQRQDPNLANSYLRNQAEGAPLIASNGDGTFTIIPRNMAQGQQGGPQGGPQPGMVEDGYRFKGGNPADPNAWEPAQGGPTPQASGGFPPSGY
jgi:hypothetical protein